MGCSAENWTLCLLEPSSTSNGEPTRERWASGAPTYGRAANRKRRTNSPNFCLDTAWWTPCQFLVSEPFLSRFASSGGPMDPHERAWFVENVLPRIDHVSSCSWGVFSPLIDLHTNIYQHLWKWLVINHYHWVDVHLLCIYVVIDGPNLVFKRREQPISS